MASMLCVVFLLLMGEITLGFIYSKSKGGRSLLRVDKMGIRSSSLEPSDPLSRTAKDAGQRALNVVTRVVDIIGGTEQGKIRGGREINAAIMRITNDMNILDEAAGQTPQLTRLELTLLAMTVFVSGTSPLLLDARVTEVLVPSMAAVSAAVSISAEYVGKVAISNGKEVAAVAIQAAAEAEALLATAERTKAVVPLCVGVATTASAFALLVPAMVAEISLKHGLRVVEEVYLICPLIAVLAAAVAGLAMQESRQQAGRAASTGNRRFASSDQVNVSWLSATEQIYRASDRNTRRWVTFAGAVLLAPVLGVFTPGTLAFKAIVTSAIASAQAAYYITLAEYSIAEATNAVAVKARTAALADTYANQGSRAGAVLPFTSALAGLCAAASAAVIELVPLISAVELQSLLAIIFPTGATMFAAAASVSKARCEVDANAASAAVSQLASSITTNSPTGEDGGPWQNVLSLIRLTARTSWKRVMIKTRQLKAGVKRRFRYLNHVCRKVFRRYDKNETEGLQEVRQE